MNNNTSNKPKYIAISGNIGVGKTTLAQLISKHFKWIPLFESVDNNPYLIDFYEDMKRWSFNLQIYFLQNKIKSIISILNGNSTYILDRTIYEDSQIFAPNLQDMGLMTSRDFDNYTQLYSTIKPLLTPPDLIIYLKASVPTLVSRITKRGREFEANISIDYLKKLNDYYEKWALNYKDGKMIIIDANENDFESKSEDLGLIINSIDANLFGLF